jgi:hypothetical protein
LNFCSRADVDDVAALPLDKMPGGLPCHQHGAGDIGGEHLLEAGEIHLDERLEHTEAGVVHQNVEVIEYLKQLPVGPEDVRFPCHVRADGMGTNCSAGGGQPLFVASRNGDFGAGLGQSSGNGEADAARAAGDQRRCAFQIHELYPRRTRGKWLYNRGEPAPSVSYYPNTTFNQPLNSRTTTGVRRAANSGQFHRGSPHGGYHWHNQAHHGQGLWLHRRA